MIFALDTYTYRVVIGVTFNTTYRPSPFTEGTPIEQHHTDSADCARCRYLFRAGGLRVHMLHRRDHNI